MCSSHSLRAVCAQGSQAPAQAPGRRERVEALWLPEGPTHRARWL
jgi:hypothetical protein